MKRNIAILVGCALIGISAQAQPSLWTNFKNKIGAWEQPAQDYAYDSRTQKQAVDVGLMLGGTTTSLFALTHKPSPYAKHAGMNFKNRFFGLNRMARLVTAATGMTSLWYGHTKLMRHSKPYAHYVASLKP